MDAPPAEEHGGDSVAGNDGARSDSESLATLPRLGLSLAAATSGASCLVTVVLIVSVLCCSASSLALLVYVLESTLRNLGAQ